MADYGIGGEKIVRLPGRSAEAQALFDAADARDAAERAAYPAAEQARIAYEAARALAPRKPPTVGSRAWREGSAGIVLPTDEHAEVQVMIAPRGIRVGEPSPTSPIFRAGGGVLGDVLRVPTPAAAEPVVRAPIPVENYRVLPASVAPSRKSSVFRFGNTKMSRVPTFASRRVLRWR